MKKRLVNGLTTDKLTRIFGVVLAIFLAVGGFLYWQGYLREGGLVLLAFIILISVISFTLGMRVAQRDGFLDGYIRAKNDLDKKK